MFEVGDIVVRDSRKNFLIKNYIEYLEEFIIGRVLEYDLVKNKLILDVYYNLNLNKINTGKFEFFASGFEKASDDIKNQFNSYIKKYSEDQDKIYIDFVESFNKANTETRSKIIEYILTTKINNE